jgi:hypothetical protein
MPWFGTGGIAVVVTVPTDLRDAGRGYHNVRFL